MKPEFKVSALYSRAKPYWGQLAKTPTFVFICYDPVNAPQTKRVFHGNSWYPWGWGNASPMMWWFCKAVSPKEHP